jgi:hypothetical protein
MTTALVLKGPELVKSRRRSTLLVSVNAHHLNPDMFGEDYAKVGWRFFDGRIKSLDLDWTDLLDDIEADSEVISNSSYEKVQSFYAEWDDRKDDPMYEVAEQKQIREVMKYKREFARLIYRRDLRLAAYIVAAIEDWTFDEPCPIVGNEDSFKVLDPSVLSYLVGSDMREEVENSFNGPLLKTLSLITGSELKPRQG